MNYSSENRIVHTASNAASVFVCLVAVVLVLTLKLHRRFVYRLSLYQVLASLGLATEEVMQIILVNYDKNPETYRRICVAFGWFGLYSEWTKLLFTMWVTFHLFCFAVLHRNMKKLEPLYVVSSLVVPGVMACVPLVTKTYGISSDGTICYLYAEGEMALIEILLIWDVPAMLILLVASTGMVVLVAKLARRVCWRLKYEEITEGDRHWKALKHLLPLVAFPILFFVFEIPVLVFHVYAHLAAPNETVAIWGFVSFALWSMTSGATVVIHISVVKVCSHQRSRNGVTIDLHGKASNNIPSCMPDVVSLANSATRFSLPPASV